MREHDGAEEAAMDKLTRTTPAMDLPVAEDLLREAKQIMDELGVVFFLRQGTCLGAIRDNALIPWDDDLDIGSIYGLHGFTEASIEPVAAAFRAHGYYVRPSSFAGETWLGLMKNNIRIDWLCFRVRQEHIVHFPAARIPVHLFHDLKEIDFIGERFLVPNPPEDYLQYKYGPNWRTPNQAGYGKDVIDNIPEGPILGHPRMWRQRLITAVFPSRAVKLRVLDGNGSPVAGAEVTLAGWSRTTTNREGYAKFYLPVADIYALVVKRGGHEEVLYEEDLAPGKTYVYTPDPATSAGRIFVLSTE
jgi:hypothetical protein